MRIYFEKVAQLLSKRKLKILTTSACLIGLASAGLGLEIYPKRAYCEGKIDRQAVDEEFYGYRSCKRFIKQYKVIQN
jgi:hypothetical protein